MASSFCPRPPYSLLPCTQPASLPGPRRPLVEYPITAWSSVSSVPGWLTHTIDSCHVTTMITNVRQISPFPVQANSRQGPERPSQTFSFTSASCVSFHKAFLFSQPWFPQVLNGVQRPCPSPKLVLRWGQWRGHFNPQDPDFLLSRAGELQSCPFSVVKKNSTPC